MSTDCTGKDSQRPRLTRELVPGDGPVLESRKGCTVGGGEPRIPYKLPMHLTMDLFSDTKDFLTTTVNRATEPDPNNTNNPFTRENWGKHKPSRHQHRWPTGLVSTTQSSEAVSSKQRYSKNPMAREGQSTRTTKWIPRTTPQFTKMAKGKSGPKPAPRKSGSKLLNSSFRPVHAPVAQSRVFSKTGPPLQRQLADGRMEITHRELVQVLVGTAAFTAVKQHINPGLVKSFGWLSTVAQMWDHYEFKDLSYEYVPQVSTAQAGTVALVFEPDALDDAPSTLERAMSYPCLDTGPTWSSLTCRIRIQKYNGLRARTMRRSRKAGDLRLFDTGTMMFCTEGNGTSTIGHIYATYRVILSDPQMGPTPSQPSSPNSISQLEITSNQSIPTTATDHLATLTLVADRNALDVVLNGAGFHLPIGIYRFDLTTSINTSAAVTSVKKVWFEVGGIIATGGRFGQDDNSANGGEKQISHSDLIHIESESHLIEVAYYCTFASGTCNIAADTTSLLISAA